MDMGVRRDFPFSWGGVRRGENSAKLEYLQESGSFIQMCHLANSFINPHDSTGNESVPIQSAQCWFPGLAIFTAKI